MMGRLNCYIMIWTTGNKPEAIREKQNGSGEIPGKAGYI